MELSLFFYSSNTSIITLYKQNLKGSEVTEQYFLSDWLNFVKKLAECMVNKVIIIDTDAEFESENIGHMYFDPSSYFIFISSEAEKDTLRKAAYKDASILPLKYNIREKSEALNRIKQDVRNVLNYFSIENRIFRKKDVIRSSNALSEMLKFYSDRLKETNTGDQVQNIIDRIYLQLEVFVDKEKLARQSEMGQKFDRKSFEEVYFLEDQKLQCPVCANQFSVKALQEDRLVKLREYDDYYCEYDNIEFLFHEIHICDSCHYAARRKDYGVNFREIIKDKIMSGKQFRKKLADRISSESDPVARAILGYEMACSCYYLFRPDYFTATIELRKYWLEKYKGKAQVEKYRNRVIELLRNGPRSPWDSSNPHVPDINLDFLMLYLSAEGAAEWTEDLEQLYGIVKNNRSREFLSVREKADEIRQKLQEVKKPSVKVKAVVKKTSDDSMMEIL